MQCNKIWFFNRDELPKHFPFCSDRCRKLDMGDWLDESNTISRPQTDQGFEDPGF